MNRPRRMTPEMEQLRRRAQEEIEKTQVQPQEPAGDKNVVDEAAMHALYSIPAPYASNIYLTQINGVFRLCFAEIIPQMGDVCPRAAVTMTFADLMNMTAFLNNTVSAIMQQQQTIPQPTIPNQDTNLDDLITKMQREKKPEEKLN